MTLPLAMLGAERSRISCPLDSVTDVLQIMAEAAVDGVAPAIELPAAAVEKYWSVEQPFPSPLQGEPPAMAWVEYSVAQARPLRSLTQAVERVLRANRGIGQPERVAVAFTAFDGAGPPTWWTEGLTANIHGNGFDTADVAHTVLGVIAGTTHFAPGRLLALAAMVVAFDVEGDDLGNHWIVLSKGDEAAKLVDQQVARQGVPGPLILSSPAWAALAGLSEGPS